MSTAAVCLVAALAVTSRSGRELTSIRQVDFRNFTHRVWGDHEMQARDGRGVLPKDADTSSPVISLVDVAYGDLTGDGRDEAVVVVWFTAGGTGSFSEGFVYILKDGELQTLAQFEGGDRAQNGIWTVAISNGKLAVERESGSCMACREEIVTTWYRWDGTALVLVRVERRKWDGKYPARWLKDPK